MKTTCSIRSFQAKHGFTLLELKMVLASLAVLASLLLPSLPKTRERALRTACENNLKSTYVLMTGYSMESNDYLSGNAASNTPHQLSVGWTDGVSNPWTETRILRNPYIRPEKWDATGQTFFCPAAPITNEDPAESNFAWSKDPDLLNAGLTTYFFLNNYARLGVSQVGLPQYVDRYHGGRMSVFDPTETLVQDWVLDQSTLDPQSDPYLRLFKSSHEGGGNVLLVDGSMDWRPESDFTTGSSATGLRKATTLLHRPTARGW